MLHSFSNTSLLHAHLIFSLPLYFWSDIFISWNLPLKQFCTFGITYLPAWLTLLYSIESTSGTHQVIVKTIVCIPLNEYFICISCHTFKQHFCWFWQREFSFFLKVENNQDKNSKWFLQQWAVRIYVLSVHSSEDVMIPFSWASKRSKDFTEVQLSLWSESCIGNLMKISGCFWQSRFFLFLVVVLILWENNLTLLSPDAVVGFWARD